MASAIKYRSYDDAPEKYHSLMRRLVPLLTTLSAGGPCFVWQSPLKADQWHRWFPEDYRILAGCKLYPKRDGKQPCLSWDPILFWSRKSRLWNEVPRDWHLVDLAPYDGYQGDNPVPCPRPLAQVEFICRESTARSIATRSWAAAPPASPASTPARSSWGSSKTPCTSTTPASASARRGRPSAVHRKPLDPARAP